MLYVVAASRDELGQLSSVSWSSSPPLNTENMLEVSTFAEVLLLLTGNSGADGSCISAAAGVCCLARPVLITLMYFLRSPIWDFMSLFCFRDLRQLLGQWRHCVSQLVKLHLHMQLELGLYLLFCCLQLREGGGDSSVVRAPDSWLKGRGFESLLERRENFLLQGRLSVLTLISVSVPPPCYHSST